MTVVIDSRTSLIIVLTLVGISLLIIHYYDLRDWLKRK